MWCENQEIELKLRMQIRYYLYMALKKVITLIL